MRDGDERELTDELTGAVVAEVRPDRPSGYGEPGEELQVDFGKMGVLFDPHAGRRRTVWSLIFTAVVSRHTFVWLCLRQTLGD